MAILPRPKAIAMNCLVCSGGIPKEVTLCHIFDCPLWAWRFGYPMRNKMYKARMERAKVRYPQEFKELEKMGIEFNRFITVP